MIMEHILRDMGMFSNEKYIMFCGLNTLQMNFWLNARDNIEKHTILLSVSSIKKQPSNQQ